ncbi:prolipoprotein diacylglyceryl transferase [Desulfosporosinus acididurans]|uniref:Phosphatidylglycerol--prolipoprotein diacylglyceryl transferase n=1 Tax=Desulfosporosinus acididurans TaxID=476652 RepID=A0A0J1ITA9_9FIRM|nr:prolipoprotein diacylglyceryl transferase [Desulfosporosinus acididurans]KLU67881.1 prolipoprotein diacylglyceryl transferase [Desulfosporosinus acididurans]
MHQFWFFIGSFPIRAYGTLFALAFVLGVGVTLYFAKAEKREEYMETMLDLAPILLLCGLLGARIWQVFFFDWSYYSKYPGEIIAIWHGGLSIQGGVVGALLGGGLYVWRKKLPFWELADLIAPGLMLAQSIGRDANLMNGDAFGGPTGGNFGILYPVGTIARDTFGNQPLWPAEVWEGQADVIIFAILVILKLKKWPSGTIFLLYLIFYNTSRFFLEGLRGDSPRFLFHWTAAQWSSSVAVIIALCLLAWRIWKDRQHKDLDNTPQDSI